jgi:hypothetical protein
VLLHLRLELEQLARRRTSAAEQCAASIRLNVRDELVKAKLC